ncbi:hypothetical protein OK349_00740 [Sphingomonas sp. BT-65]|uniref:hypothetical protein n=1 Tax=Sphingomonas sp. BT-65 TaxID=2989821 RepID=UPI0022364925|nr:hypothetical protein [Sphingomonas sp. BT-65]MCW4460220.1 hypothetical protein [Sphingomonas sp. BT-65]
MAYLAFAEHGAAFATPGAVRTAPESARFSALEWSVVALAERDRLSSLREPGRMAVALGSLFGERRSTRLADPKLEALRRMAVLTWHNGYRVAQSAVRGFLAAGFTPDHYELLTGSIVAARVKRDRRNSR